MRMSDVPEAAFAAPATTVPTKIQYDWEALFDVMQQQGFVIIESDVVRTRPDGQVECVIVKAFNCHVRTTQKKALRTKRIGSNRWFCCL